MSKLPRISEAEWEIMKILWAKSPRSASDIIAALQAADPSWHPKTAKTLLNRLVKKRALAFRREGRAYLYRPQAREAECVSAASESFLDRVFGGSLQPMLAHFVEREKLSPAEIAELKKILNKQEEP